MGFTLSSKIKPIPRITPEEFEDLFVSRLCRQDAPDYCKKLGPCRVWTTGKGYISVKVRDKWVGLHRLALETFRPGELSDKNPLVLHHCDVIECIAELHLWAGTNLDNIQDMMQKGRGHWQFSPRSVERRAMRYYRSLIEIYKPRPDL